MENIEILNRMFYKYFNFEDNFMPSGSNYLNDNLDFDSIDNFKTLPKKNERICSGRYPHKKIHQGLYYQQDGR